jgi:hypothetical protein
VLFWTFRKEGVWELGRKERMRNEGEGGGKKGKMRKVKEENNGKRN